jgi:hypothetical protein
MLGVLPGWGGCATAPMADAPYLVALALMEQEGRRALPLIGKSRAVDAAADADPGEAGHGLALALLLRIWQRSEEGMLRRAAGPDSLLLLEMPLEGMSARLPVLKAAWLGGGETAVLLQGLRDLAVRGWSLSIAKYEPITYAAW